MHTKQYDNLFLLSGGIESITMLHLYATPSNSLALFIDYAQRAARQEYHYSELHCKQLGIALKKFDLAGLGQSFRADHEYALHIAVPHRNFVALALATSYAEQCSAANIFIGVTLDDQHNYASANTSFLDAISRVIEALKGDLHLRCPFRDLRKHDVVALGRQAGLDYATTYSCMLGKPAHCGHCPQCRARLGALEGRPDL